VLHSVGSQDPLCCGVIADRLRVLWRQVRAAQRLVSRGGQRARVAWAALAAYRGTAAKATDLLHDGRL